MQVIHVENQHALDLVMPMQGGSMRFYWTRVERLVQSPNLEAPAPVRLVDQPADGLLNRRIFGVSRRRAVDKNIFDAIATVRPAGDDVL